MTVQIQIMTDVNMDGIQKLVILSQHNQLIHGVNHHVLMELDN
jgi:hypothetical protein